MYHLSLRLDVTANDKRRKQWHTKRIGGLVVPCQCSIKIILIAPFGELTHGFRNFLHIEDLLGQLVPGRSYAPLNMANKRGRHMLVRLGTSSCLSQIASQFGCRLAGSSKDRFMDYNNLVVLQFFGLVLGVAVLIMRTDEFERDEIVAGN